MAHFKKPRQKKKEGKIVYGDGIVNTIVTLAIAEIPYVKLYSGNARGKDYSKAISVKFNNKDVFVDVAVKINYLQSVSDMAFKIQEVVRHNVESMTEYHISAVNVCVKGVLFDEKPAVSKKTKKIVQITSEESVVEAPKIKAKSSKTNSPTKKLSTANSKSNKIAEK